NCKIDLLTQEYKKFSISNNETIDSGFTRSNVIVTSLESLDSDNSSKNHVRKFLRAPPLKWRAKVIEEAKDLATLLLDELVENFTVYEMILENNIVVSKTTSKEKFKLLALKAKVTREQTSDDSDSQRGSDEDVDEEEAEAFNLMARNFRKFFRNGIDLGAIISLAYDGGHVIFRSNLKGKVVGGGNIAHDSITITNVEHVSGLAFNLISVDEGYPKGVKEARGHPIEQVTDEGYPKGVKEARGHPIEQVTGELNERILRELKRSRKGHEHLPSWTNVLLQII
nr:UBN2 domain-containing protein [Tanacetum cinerariifolium]